MGFMVSEFSKYFIIILFIVIT